MRLRVVFLCLFVTTAWSFPSEANEACGRCMSGPRLAVNSRAMTVKYHYQNSCGAQVKVEGIARDGSVTIHFVQPGSHVETCNGENTDTGICKPWVQTYLTCDPKPRSTSAPQSPSKSVVPPGTATPRPTTKSPSSDDADSIAILRMCAQTKRVMDEKCRALGHGPVAVTCLGDAKQSYDACTSSGDFKLPAALVPSERAKLGQSATDDAASRRSVPSSRAPSQPQRTQTAPRYDCRYDDNMPAWCHPGDPRYPHGR